MIYFFQNPDNNLIKIGYTGDDVESRRKDGLTWCPYGLVTLATMPGDKPKEKRLHRRFAADHVGGEWFRPSIELQVFIGTLSPDCLTPDGLLEEVARRNPQMNEHRDTWRWRAMKRIAALYTEDELETA